MKRKNWVLLRFLNAFSTNQGALAVIMKGRLVVRPVADSLMVSVRWKWLDFFQLLVHARGICAVGKSWQGFVLNGEPCFCKWIVDLAVIFKAEILMSFSGVIPKGCTTVI